MDQTQLFYEISRKKAEENGMRFDAGPKTPAKSDKLTMECSDMKKSIQDLKSYLQRIRPAYLSSTKRIGSADTLTDKQREDIDYETRMIIQRQLARLENLENLEKERVEKHNQSRTALQKFMSDSKAEGTMKTVALHRQGMFLYLRDRLKQASDLQASQQQTRLSRQVEKAKSRLHYIPDSLAYRGSPVPVEQMDKEQDAGFDEQQLPPELQQELESENNALLEELEMSLEKAKSAEKSMMEISQLQTTLATHLAAQTDMVTSLVDDAFDTTGDVTLANKQLDAAKTRNRRTSKMIIWGAIVIALILLLYDFIL